ncbi:MAG: M3 family metallopeptidase [Gemmatimonadetes bacterium]|nr:M3 family metallopeptidase [Gemmatimonadota bacterium]
MISESNPLLTDAYRIPFHRIRAEHVGPGVRQALSEAQRDIDDLVADTSPPTWDNTLGRLDGTVERLARRIAPASHLVSVAETPELREAYNAVLPEISAFWSRLPLNQGLWERMRAFAGTPEAQSLEGLKRRHLDKTVQDFRRAGADLPPGKKARLEALKVDIAQLTQRFAENVLDATAAYERHVEDESRLAGVPEQAKRRARSKAEEKGLSGVVLTLDYPSVEPILKYCDDRELRREIQTAYASRCREGDYDNRALLARILVLRDELAGILGYDGYPDYKLEDRMAKTGARAVEFEAEMCARTHPYWERDVAELQAHAAELGLDSLEPWDVAYVMEKLRKERYDIDDEVLRPYFPLDQVLAGLFEIVRRTFGFHVEERCIDEVWHGDVRFFEIFDENGVNLGGFYSDWFPRKEKRQGAWMNDFITGGPRDGTFAPHLGVICGNFTPPEGDDQPLLTHREVETTFHEFGHLLHHCTSRVEIPGRAGINVAWDWVELPSQLMENWCWEEKALELFARHHETGEPFPDELFQRMVAARRFMGGWAQMRQLSFGTVDLALHGELAPRLRAERAASDGNAEDEQTETEVDRRLGEEAMEFTRSRFTEFSPSASFANLHPLTSFTHLFAGGYAAGYYSYLWSEVLDADVFTRFKGEGIFNRETGRDYVDSILSRGDSADPEELFRSFMGRDPDPTALLERNLGPAPE